MDLCRDSSYASLHHLIPGVTMKFLGLIACPLALPFHSLVAQSYEPPLTDLTDAPGNLSLRGIAYAAAQ